MRPQRKNMCKTCIYRTNIGKKLKGKVLKHACHEMSDNRATCAGAINQGEKLEIMHSTPEETKQWGECVTQNWEEIAESVFRNRVGKETLKEIIGEI
jgi:hypothetical protein